MTYFAEYTSCIRVKTAENGSIVKTFKGEDGNYAVQCEFYIAYLGCHGGIYVLSSRKI